MYLFFFFNDTATTEIYTLSLHDALPIFKNAAPRPGHEIGQDQTCAATSITACAKACGASCGRLRSEEHTSELQSPCNLVCRLLLEKKKKREYCAERAGHGTVPLSTSGHS